MSLYNFDQPVEIGQHNFVKANPTFLKNMFGATDITPLWIADMDFRIAKPITDAIERLAQRGVFAYEFPPQEIHQSLSAWYLRKNALALNPDHFMVINGVLTGIAVILHEFSKKGDNILIQTPVYHQFAKAIKENGRNVITNSLKLENNRYVMDFEDLEQKLIQDQPQLILLCNPHNPVGRVWEKEELSQLVELAKKYDTLIVSDEIHSDIVFKGATFNSLTTFDYDKTIALIGSPAKTFGMQSIAAGYIYSDNNEYRKKLQHKIEAMYLNHTTSLTMYALKAAYDEGDDWLNALLAYLQQSRDEITDFIQKNIPEVSVIQSDGTYQLWLDFRKLDLSNEELDHLFFQKSKVGLAPGYWFGEDGSGFARINYASPRSVIMDALERLQQAIPSKM